MGMCEGVIYFYYLDKLELQSLLNVSRNTTRSYLHDLGYRICIAPNKPYLSEKHKLDRLKFAHGHESWTFENWCNMIW